MEIYFIRHGETDGNRQHRHQFDTTPLNERGRRQASIVADLVPAFGPTHLISSPLERARETASYIEAATKLTPVFNEAFVEIKRPKRIHGLRHFQPRSLWYLIVWFLSGRRVFDDAEQGESYGAFMKRIEASKRVFDAYPSNASIVVVSHSVFINFFVAHCCRPNPISLFGAFLRFAKIINLDNSSVTHVRYRPDALPGTCAWEVVSFDNDAHVVR